MRRTFSVVLGALAATVLVVASGPMAQGAAGRVVVFSVEVVPLEIYENPTGCQRLPDGAHVLANLTDQDLTVYADPLCFSPVLVVSPDYGTHVPPAGATFKV